MITERFLTLFNEFLKKYKYYGEPRFYHYYKEKKFTIMYEKLSGILVFITENQAVFNDVTIIEHLNKTIFTATDTNPYLLKCWTEFHKNYHNKNNSSLESVTKEEESEGTHLDQMVLELQFALTQSIQSAEQAEKNHAAEIARLKEQIESLKDENALLVLQIHQQLANAQKDLLSLTNTMNTLHEMTQLKPKTENTTHLTRIVEISKPSIENVPDIKAKNTTNTNDNVNSMLTNLHKPIAPSRGVAKTLSSRASSIQEEKKDSSKPKVATVPQKEKKSESLNMATQMQAELMKKLNAIRKVTEDKEKKEKKEKNTSDPSTPDSWDNLSNSQ